MPLPKPMPSKDQLVDLMLNNRFGKYPNWSALGREFNIDAQVVVKWAKKYELIDKKRQGPIVENIYLPIPEKKKNRDNLNKSTLEKRLISKREIDGETSCWIWCGHWTPSGYGQMTLSGARRRAMEVHKVAAYVWLDQSLDEKTFIFHTCGVKACFNPDHFRICNTRREMLKLRKKYNLHQVGDKVSSAKISLATALDIRDAIKMGEETNKQIGERLNVNSRIVYSIRAKISWKHIWKIKHEYA